MKAMCIPISRERVYMKGKNGPFLVLRVDQQRRVADLIHTISHTVENQVPFADLTLIRQRDEAVSGSRGPLNSSLVNRND